MSVSKLFLLAAIAACAFALPHKPSLKNLKEGRSNFVVIGGADAKNYTPAELPCSYQVTVDEEYTFLGETEKSISYSSRNKDHFMFQMDLGNFASYHLLKPVKGVYYDHDYSKDEENATCHTNPASEGELEFFQALYFSRFTETFEYTNVTKDYNFYGTKCTAYSIAYEHDFGTTTRFTYVDKDDRIIGTLFDDGEDYELEKYTYKMDIPASKFKYDKKLEGCDEDAYTEPTTGICTKEDEPSSSASIVRVAKAMVFMMVALVAFLF